MQDIYLGRQSIYDRELEVAAYEILYRSGTTNAAHFVSEDAATSQVLLNTLTEIGLEAIVGKHPAYINMTRTFLLGGEVPTLPREQLVLEVLEREVVNAELVDGLAKLAHQGYRIALDDFEYREDTAPLLKIADIVKVDVLHTPPEQLPELVEVLRRHRLKLLAEKIETREQLEHCRSLGFELFQGYYFSQPKLLQHRTVPTNRVALLQLLAQLHDPDITIQQVKDIINQDLSLSYKLLRYINSAFFSLPAPVNSIHRAVVALGLINVKSWATLVTIAEAEGMGSDLATTALIRARMCAILAKRFRLGSADTGFTIGLLSTLDALMGIPMDQILTSLPLSEEINEALLNHEGSLGQALACVLAYERGDWEAVDANRLDHAMVSSAYLTALREACARPEESIPMLHRVL